MTKHVTGQAKALFPVGEHRLVEVAVQGVKEKKTKYEYDARCADCGCKLGVVRHDAARLDHNPADCGLICGSCAGARAAESTPEEAVGPVVEGEA